MVQIKKRHGVSAKITITYLDESLAIIDKPAGLLAVSLDHGTARNAVGLLKAALVAQKQADRVWIVQRLDRDTSGLMMVARTETAWRRLTEDWYTMVPEREYIAIVHGQPKQAAGQVHNWLKQTKTLRVYAIDHQSPDAEEAITNYQTIRNNGRFTWLKIAIKTGRPNQIRVNLAGLGCPIVGDGKYGRPDGHSRLALHANQLGFTHPQSNRFLRFTSPAPAFFTTIAGSA